MNRRQLLKLLALGVGSLELDIDSLLWVPGKKTIFLPDVPTGMSIAQIVRDYTFILPHMKNIFERDNLFYEVLAKETHIISKREMKIPLELKPGLYDRPTDNKIH